MMKNLMKVLALVAVLAMAGTTFADTQIHVFGNTEFTVERLDDPSAGLEAYLVSTKGASAFKGLTIASGVHQTFYDYYGAKPTPFSDSIIDQLPEWQLMRATDTCFMFPSTDGPIITTGTISETSTLAGSPISMNMPAMVGMGTIGDPGADFGFSQDVYDINTPLQLMQVVIPASTQVFITGRAGVDGQNWEVNCPVGVPEPSTILMLLAGSLCLLAIRRK